MISASQSLFATKGFYGTSIRDVAESVSIAKSSLLHHFPSKEKLYGTVLQTIAAEMTQEIRDIRNKFPDELDQMNEVVKLLCLNTKRKKNRDVIILREMLDNPKRATKSKKWYFASYLDELVGIIRSGYGKGRFKKTNPGTFVLHLLGAHHYFVISLPTVKHLFDPEAFQEMIADHQTELNKILQERLMAEPDVFKEDK